MLVSYRTLAWINCILKIIAKRACLSQRYIAYIGSKESRSANDPQFAAQHSAHRTQKQGALCSCPANRDPVQRAGRDAAREVRVSKEQPRRHQQAVRRASAPDRAPDRTSDRTSKQDVRTTKRLPLRLRAPWLLRGAAGLRPRAAPGLRAAAAESSGTTNTHSKRRPRAPSAAVGRPDARTARKRRHRPGLLLDPR